MKKLSSGRSLLEILSVLAISAIMISLAVILGSRVTGQTKRNLTYNSVKELSVDIKAHFWGRDNYTGLTNTKLITDGFEKSSLKDAWNNELKVSEVSGKKAFIIQINFSDKKDCSILEEKFGQDPDIDSVKKTDGDGCSLDVQFKG